jgi:hypothetical protein
MLLSGVTAHPRQRLITWLGPQLTGAHRRRQEGPPVLAPRPEPAASAVAAIERRQLLRGIAGVAAALSGGWVMTGCSGDAVPPAPTPPAAPDPDDAIVVAAAASVRRLLDAYDATVTAHPELAERLEPLAAEHRIHLAALGAAEPPAPATATAGTASPSPLIPADPTAAVAALVTAEEAAAADRVAATEAASPRLARLLASIGASEATHAALLGAG